MNNILLINGIFYTQTHGQNDVTALLIERGKISPVMHKGETIPTDVKIIDLDGRSVYPGFIDTHTHSFEGGLYSGGVDLMDCKTVSQALDMIRAHADTNNGKDTIFCWRYDENGIEEKRFPTISELDSISNSRPVVIRRIDGHSCVVNSYILKMLDLKQQDIFRGDQNDRIVHYLHANLTDNEILRAYETAAQIALKAGFTTIHTMIGDANQSLTHYKLVRDNLMKFPIDYVIYPQCFNIEAALDLGATRIGGCILADGSFGSFTAALSENYLNSNRNGVLYQTDSFWDEFITIAHSHDLQVAVHCIGDLAIKQINDIYLKLARNDPKDLRHELIHMELTPDTLLDEIALSGAKAVMQPAFDHYWGGTGRFYESVLGKARSRVMNRFNSIVRRDIGLCFGSDWYITELDPIKGIFAALNHSNPLERIDLDQAIQAYTSGAAALSHEEDLKGKICEGYRGDLTILDLPLDSMTSEITPQVCMVIKDGDVVYERS